MAHPNPFELRHHRPDSGGDLVKQFLSTYGSRKTRRNYRTDLRQFFEVEAVTRLKASQVGEEDITEFLRGRADSLKRATLKRKLETIRSFFRWSARQNMIGELPIREEPDTGDLVDQILEEVRETTEGEGGSRTAEEPDGKDEGDSGGSRVGPVPMELEPGSQVILDRETDSGSEKSSLPGSQAEVTESPPSEVPSREEHRSGESSSDGSTGSDPDSDVEDPSKEDSMENQDTREEPIREGGTEENSTDNDSTGENSDGEDQPSIPDWALASGDAKEIDLHRGEKVALVKLPDALHGALPRLKNTSGPEGLFIRCTSDLKVQIRRHLGQNSQIIEAAIEHYVLQRILRNEGDLAERHVLRQAILYLHDLNWTLPPTVYGLIDTLPDHDDADGSFSEKCPRWRREATGDGLGDAFLAAQITGVLAEGFGIEKHKEVFVGT